MAKKSADFKNNTPVIVRPDVLSDNAKRQQVLARTKLTENDLDQPMMAIRTVDGQATVRHPRRPQTFVLHSKFLQEHAQ